MREIKFRVWDIKMGRFNWNQNIFINSQFSDTILIAHPFENEYPKNRFIIQQYTGLKDKNSKEIYEGDILRKFFISEPKPNDNKFPAFEVKWNEQHCGFGITVGARHFYEIIGNIFENHELLK